MVDKTKHDSLEKEFCRNGILVIDTWTRNEFSLMKKKVYKIDKSISEAGFSLFYNSRSNFVNHSIT